MPLGHKTPGHFIGAGAAGHGGGIEVLMEIGNSHYYKLHKESKFRVEKSGMKKTFQHEAKPKCSFDTIITISHPPPYKSNKR